MWSLIGAVEALADKKRNFFQMFPREKKAFFECQAALLGLSPEVIRNKWNSLTTSYKRIKDNAGSKNTGRGTLERWQFFAAMDDLLGARSSTKPRYVLETGVPETVCAPSKENVLPQPLTTTRETKASDKNTDRTPARKQGVLGQAQEAYYTKKVKLEERRLALEERRLEMEGKRLELLNALVTQITKNQPTEQKGDN